MSTYPSSPASKSQELPKLPSGLVPPVAASLALPWIFQGFMNKSKLQLERQPNVNFKEGFIQGVKTIPTVGVLISTQLVLKELADKRFGEEGSLQQEFAVAGGIGLAASPVVHVFNHKSAAPVSVVESLKRFGFKDAALITVQEACFVLGMSTAKPLAAAAKERFGDNQAVEVSANYAAGAMGALVGHAPNTYITRSYGNLSTSLRDLPRGAVKRAHAVGIFSVLYNVGKKYLPQEKE